MRAQVAIVKNATLGNQQVWEGTVSTIVDQTRGAALSPCIVIIGPIAQKRT